MAPDTTGARKIDHDLETETVGKHHDTLYVKSPRGPYWKYWDVAESGKPVRFDWSEAELIKNVETLEPIRV